MWLHVPASCLSAPATADSTSPCEPRFQDLERSAMWRGKPRALRFWRLAWRKVGWMQLLSGVTSPPSMHERGVAQWISSLLDSHASRRASRGSGGGSMTSAGSGRLSPTSSSSAEPQLSFSRTSLASYRRGSGMSSQTLTASGSMRNGVCSTRDRLAPRTVAIGGSAWPMPDASVWTGSSRSCSAGAAVRPALALLASRWPTPTASDAAASGASGYSTESGRHSGTTLTDAAVRAREGTARTPPATTAWSTPTARDWKDGADPKTSPTSKRQGGDPLGLQAPRIMKVGGTGLVLNPPFVEALMGLPIGWTDCGCSATASSGSKPRERFVNSRSEHD